MVRSDLRDSYLLVHACCTKALLPSARCHGHSACTHGKGSSLKRSHTPTTRSPARNALFIIQRRRLMIHGRANNALATISCGASSERQVCNLTNALCLSAACQRCSDTTAGRCSAWTVRRGEAQTQPRPPYRTQDIDRWTDCGQWYARTGGT